MAWIRSTLALLALASSIGTEGSDASTCPANAKCNGGGSSASDEDMESGDDMNLMQVMSVGLTGRKSTSRETLHRDATLAAETTSEHCTNLENHGSYFTINVGIGTPSQFFPLVADTGSNGLIAPSCNCIANGFCPEDMKQCFDEKKDSSLLISTGLDMKTGQVGVDMVAMSYGSGTIINALASDYVQVANLTAKMKKIYLMQDRRKLKVSGDFEGILGLGRPSVHGAAGQLWAEAANVPRYTLCFNDMGKPGTFVADVPNLPNAMDNIGAVHWGLDLQGMSVGGESAPVLFCDKKLPGMQTACGAIPDSGTTLIMGPQKQIITLYGAICDAWPRCVAAAAKTGASKDLVFQKLLHWCGEWLDNSTGLAEVPSITLHLAGGDGVKRTFDLSAWSYITEATGDVVKVVTKNLYGFIPVHLSEPTGIKTKTCSASFAPQDYNTMLNGPVWILGTPLFYQYTVGYDVSRKPQQIALIDEPCTECGAAKPALLAEGRPRRSMPRVLKGNLREPRTQMSGPL